MQVTCPVDGPFEATTPSRIDEVFHYDGVPAGAVGPEGLDEAALVAAFPAAVRVDTQLDVYPCPVCGTPVGVRRVAPAPG